MISSHMQRSVLRNSRQRTLTSRSSSTVMVAITGLPSPPSDHDNSFRNNNNYDRNHRRRQVACFHRGIPTQHQLEKQMFARYKEQDPIKWTTDRLSPEQIEKVDKIFHKILWLDIVEAGMLAALLNEKFELKLTPKQRKGIEKFQEQQLLASVGGSGGPSASDEKEGEKEEAAAKLLELKLTGFDAKSKIKVIKEVRAIAGLGLKEAKELVESVPKVVAKDLKQEAADELKAKLEAVGAQVELS